MLANILGNIFDTKLIWLKIINFIKPRKEYMITYMFTTGKNRESIAFGSTSLNANVKLNTRSGFLDIQRYIASFLNKEVDVESIIILNIIKLNKKGGF